MKESINEVIFASLQKAVRDGNIDEVQSRLQQGNIDVNIRATLAKVTLLHFALENSKNEIAIFLLEQGANPNLQELSGKTPLHMAAVFGNTAMVSYLLDRVVNIDKQDSLGRTPLHWAIMNGHKETAMTLLNHGSNVVAQDNLLKTPIHLAAGKGFTEFIKTQTCADALNAQDKDGKTPLHYAAENGKEEAVSLLIRNGANTEQHDIMERTPRQIAVERGHTTVVEVMSKIENDYLEQPDFLSGFNSQDFDGMSTPQNSHVASSSNRQTETNTHAANSGQRKKRKGNLKTPH